LQDRVRPLPRNSRDAAPAFCAICGACAALTGVDFVFKCTRALVCESCAQRFAPQVVAALRDCAAARLKPCPRCGAEPERPEIPGSAPPPIRHHPLCRTAAGTYTPLDDDTVHRCIEYLQRGAQLVELWVRYTAWSDRHRGGSVPVLNEERTKTVDPASRGLAASSGCG